MTNKEMVIKFYDDVFNNWDLSKVDEYVREDYKQHSAGVQDGREGFKSFITEFIKKKPRIEIVKALEDGDMVCLFFKCSFENGVVAKVFDMFRVQDGQVAEHWDCTARVDDIEQAAGNGHF